MGIVERIRQIQEEQAHKAADEAARIAATPEAQAARRESEERIAKQAERRNFVNSKVNAIVLQTHILEILQEINTKMLNKPGIAHGIVRQQNEAFDRHDDAVTFKLLWRDEGSYPDLYKECMKNPSKIENGYGYYFIEAKIDPDTESIRIQGENNGVITLNKEKWFNNIGLVEDALAQAFLNPWYAGDGQGQTGWF